MEQGRHTGSAEIRGRFAPSPTGRMHMGNVWTALLSWLSVKSRGGTWILRHEDLDPQRSRYEYAQLIDDDLQWLGLEWDEGGVADSGPYAPYRQSMRGDRYAEVLERLRQTGLLYGCRCRRADLLAASAPHASDGRAVYAGTCRPSYLPALPPGILPDSGAIRLAVADTVVEVDDLFCGRHSYNLPRECGDFVVRRADGTFAYQLAVVADDAAMDVTEVVRGADLLPSAAQQIYLFRLLGVPAPCYGHVPLLVNSAGQRLSKRDSSLSMEELRRRYSPRQLTGRLAWLAGIIDNPDPCSPQQLAAGGPDIMAPLRRLLPCIQVC